jgi:hypothetical protein
MMLDRLILLLFVLVILPGVIWKEATVSGGAGPGLTILHQMDFEGDACTDTGGDTCTKVGVADMDCGAGVGACPLEPDLSFREIAGIEGAYKDDLAEITTGSVTLDFMWRPVSGTWSGMNAFMGMISVEGNYECRFRYDSVNSVDAQSNEGISSSDITVTSGTTYYVRLTYDTEEDLCRLMVSETDFGNTGVGNVLADGASAGSVVGWQKDNAQTTEMIWDDIQYCEGDAGTTEGICGS